MRNCKTCQHLKRPEIDRRLATGEPVAQIARDYELTASSAQRHRINCLKLGSSNAIKKDPRGEAPPLLYCRRRKVSEAPMPTYAVASMRLWSRPSSRDRSMSQSLD